MTNGSSDVLDKLGSDAAGFAQLLAGAGGAEADGAAEIILGLNSGGVEADTGLLERLMQLVAACSSEKMRTVAVGTLWRDDVAWLDEKLGSGETARELLLKAVASDDPQSLAPVFWRAVAERGPRFALIAYTAASETHPHEAAKLLVSICRAALAGRLELQIGEAVDAFLEGRDSSVRTSLLAAIKRMPEEERRKLMTHLDMSLMAELDKSAIEHRGEDFYYDEDEERRKRDRKGEDIFGEVRRRLERGDKPQF